MMAREPRQCQTGVILKVMSWLFRNKTLPCLLLTAVAAFGQKPPDKASAYYHYSLGHLYAELAGAYSNRADYFNKAIESYREALKEDPSATFITEELSELYIQSGRLREAVTEAEEALKANPNDVSARRVLARIYTRMIGDSQANKVDEEMLRKSIDQYQKITVLEPKDTDGWLMLGRLQKIAQNSAEAVKAYKKALELDPENDDAMTGLALVYADLGETKQAADLLRRAAEKNPNPRSLTTLASAYEQMHEYPLAVETLRRALDQQPGNNEIKHALAQDLLLTDQMDAALKIYQELVAEDPRDVQSWLRISQAYRQKHDYAKAHEASEKAKELEPGSLEIQFNDVSLLEAEGKPRDAIKTLTDLLATSTKASYSASEKQNRIVLLEKLGFLHRSVENYPAAVDSFREIGTLDPDSGARSSAQIIDTWRAAKEFGKAEAEADAAAKKYPKDRVVRSVRATLLADLGKTDLAAAETRKLFDGKNDRETWLSLAQIQEKAKNFPEMAKSLDEAEKLSTNKEDKEAVLFLRGSMYERQKNFDAAEAEFRKVLSVNPDNAAALNYLGYMLADRNVRLQEAQDMIKRALAKEPNNGAYLDSMGWVYFRLNKLPEAEEELKQALAGMAHDPTVQDHLGDVYFHEGKTREAIAQWQSSLKAWEASAPSEQDHAEVAKIQKKLENAKIKLAKEPGSSR